MVIEKSKTSTKSQGARFIDAARSLGCDESEERFDEALKKVARHKLAPSDADKEPEKVTGQSSGKKGKT